MAPNIFDLCIKQRPTTLAQRLLRAFADVCCINFIWFKDVDYCIDVLAYQSFPYICMWFTFFFFFFFFIVDTEYLNSQLGKAFRSYFEILFLIFPENWVTFSSIFLYIKKAWHFMQTISLVDKLHEISNVKLRRQFARNEKSHFLGNQKSITFHLP